MKLLNKYTPLRMRYGHTALASLTGVMHVLRMSEDSVPSRTMLTFFVVYVFRYV